MDSKELEQLLRSFKSGDLNADEAARRINNLHYEDIGYAKVDHGRASRQGFPEVVFGAGKTRKQVVGIVERLAQRSPNVIVTHTDADTFGEVRNGVTEAEWHESARLIRIQRDNTESGIARELVEAGIPKDRIVLGFRPPEVRPYTDYATA